MLRGVVKRHTYLIRAKIGEEIKVFAVGRFDHAPRFRWLCRDGRYAWVNLYRDDIIWHHWNQTQPVPMLREERNARAA